MTGLGGWQQVLLTFPIQTALFVDFLETSFVFLLLFKLHPSSFSKQVPVSPSASGRTSILVDFSSEESLS